MIHSRFRRCFALIRDSIFNREHHPVLAHIDFGDMDDFRAACIAIRNRHGQTE